MLEFNEYETSVANAIVNNPTLACLDIVGYYEYTPDPINNSIMIERKSEVQDFLYNTSKVDICYVELTSHKERKVLNR